MKKVIQNLNTIILVLSIISVTLIGINIVPFLDYSFNAVNILRLLVYALSLVASIIVLVNAVRKKLDQKIVNIAMLFLLAGTIISYSYSVVNGTDVRLISSFSTVSMLILAVGTTVLYAVSIANKKVIFISRVFLLIQACICLLSVFNGSSYNLACLGIYAIVLLYSVFKEENVEVEAEEKNEE